MSTKFKFEVVTPAILAQMRHRSAIFDGEVVVWHKALQEFLPFNMIKQVVYAAARDIQAGEEVVRAVGAVAVGEAGAASVRVLLAFFRCRSRCLDRASPLHVLHGDIHSCSKLHRA